MGFFLSGDTTDQPATNTASPRLFYGLSPTEVLAASRFGYHSPVFIDARDLDFRSQPPGPVFSAEVCIVGAGAAGISLALELDRAGHDVLLLESGGFAYEEDTQSLYAGRGGGSFLKPEELYLSSSRVRRFGGTTSHWNGWCLPLDAQDFKHRAWIDHSGWPLSREELDPYYRCAAPYLDIGELAQESPPLFEQDSEFESVYFLISAPTRFGLKYRQTIAESDRIRVILHANLVEMRAAENKQVVEHLVASTLEGGRVEVAARHFVLACGGVENARLLLVFDREGGGVRLESDALGRFFMDHPITRVGWVAVAHGRRSRMQAYDRFRRPGGSDYARGVVRPKPEVEAGRRWARSLFVLKRETWRSAGEFSPVVGEAAAVMARAAEVPGRLEGVPYVGEVSAVIEQRPNRASRVTLSDELDALGMPRAVLDWRLDDDDVRTIEETVDHLRRSLGAAFEGRMQRRFVADDPWRTAGGSNHHMGTTRMGSNRADAVVDSRCTVHGVDNLHLAGSSVFPTCGAVNPTYTIVALAIRLADWLHQELA